VFDILKYHKFPYIALNHAARIQLAPFELDSSEVVFTRAIGLSLCPSADNEFTIPWFIAKASDKLSARQFIPQIKRRYAYSH